MEMERQQPLSHLFTVRLWQEELGNGQTEVRGKVQHVSSGEVRYFRDWPTLITFLQALLSTPRSPGQSD
jgi:hypothetical protein